MKKKQYIEINKTNYISIFNILFLLINSIIVFGIGWYFFINQINLKLSLLLIIESLILIINTSYYTDKCKRRIIEKYEVKEGNIK